MTGLFFFVTMSIVRGCPLMKSQYCGRVGLGICENSFSLKTKGQDMGVWVHNIKTYIDDFLLYDNVFSVSISD
jgi:hypothetical protein